MGRTPKTWPMWKACRPDPESTIVAVRTPGHILVPDQATARMLRDSLDASLASQSTTDRTAWARAIQGAPAARYPDEAEIAMLREKQGQGKRRRPVAQPATMKPRKRVIGGGR